MAIVVEHLDTQQGPAVRARVRCGDDVVIAWVYGTIADLASRLGRQCSAETTVADIAGWRELPDLGDDDLCVMPSADLPDAVIVRGRVRSVVQVDEGLSVIDLSLGSGPERLTLDSMELGGWVPGVGTPLEVAVHGLCFYPVDV